MSRLRSWRDDPPVLPSERRAMRQEVLVLWFLVIVMFLSAYAEPIMDWLEGVLR